MAWRLSIWRSCAGPSPKSRRTVTSTLQCVDFCSHLAITYQCTEDEPFFTLVHLPRFLFQNICGHLIWHLTVLGTCWRHFCSHRWHMQRIRDFLVIVGYTSLLFTFTLVSVMIQWWSVALAVNKVADFSLIQCTAWNLDTFDNLSAQASSVFWSQQDRKC